MWPLRYVAAEKWNEPGYKHRVGDWTYALWLLVDWPDRMGSHYHKIPHEPPDNPRRLPIVIVLPDKSRWCPDMRARSEHGQHGDGWEVKGPEGKWTIMPSIHVVGSYHGWVRDGMLTDDIEGHVFPFTGPEPTPPMPSPTG